MECPGLLEWIAAEVVLGAIDVALGSLRRRVLDLALCANYHRQLVLNYKAQQERDATGEGWPLLEQARKIRNIVDKEYYYQLNLYFGYRAYHNERWGLRRRAKWRALPAYARRGYAAPPRSVELDQ